MNPDLYSLDPVKWAARQFGVQAHNVDRVGGGFSSAMVFRVTADDGQAFAVRCTPLPSALPPERLAALHSLLTRIFRRAIPTISVPLIRVHDLNGYVAAEETAKIPGSAAAGYIQISTCIQAGQNVWQVEPWLPGDSLALEPTRVQLMSALSAIHAFHHAAFEESRHEKHNEWFFVSNGPSPGVKRRLAAASGLSDGMLQELIGETQSDPDPEFRRISQRLCNTLRRWIPWLMSRLRQAAEQNFLLQPVIRDLWKAHVLYTGDSVTGLIDLSAMASDHVTFDITRLFRSWYGADSAEIVKAVQIFEKERPLNAPERALITTLDGATVLLSPVTWLQRRVESKDRQPLQPNVLARLRELIEIAGQFEPLSL